MFRIGQTVARKGGTELAKVARLPHVRLGCEDHPELAKPGCVHIGHFKLFGEDGSVLDGEEEGGWEEIQNEFGEVVFGRYDGRKPDKKLAAYVGVHGKARQETRWTQWERRILKGMSGNSNCVDYPFHIRRDGRIDGKCLEFESWFLARRGARPIYVLAGGGCGPRTFRHKFVDWVCEGDNLYRVTLT